jgi:hypothetical protein
MDFETGSNLSKSQAELIPSLLHIKPGALIAHNDLLKILHSSSQAELFDCEPRLYMYSSKIDWKIYGTSRQLYFSEKELLNAILMGWNDPNVLNFQTIWDIRKRLNSKAKQLDFLRVLGEALSDLPYSQSIVDDIFVILKSQNEQPDKSKKVQPYFKDKQVSQAYNVPSNFQEINSAVMREISCSGDCSVCDSACRPNAQKLCAD